MGSVGLCFAASIIQGVLRRDPQLRARVLRCACRAISSGWVQLVELVYPSVYSVATPAGFFLLVPMDPSTPDWCRWRESLHRSGVLRPFRVVGVGLALGRDDFGVFYFGLRGCLSGTIRLRA